MALAVEPAALGRVRVIVCRSPSASVGALQLALPESIVVVLQAALNKCSPGTWLASGSVPAHESRPSSSSRQWPRALILLCGRGGPAALPDADACGMGAAGGKVAAHGRDFVEPMTSHHFEPAVEWTAPLSLPRPRARAHARTLARCPQMARTCGSLPMVRLSCGSAWDISGTRDGAGAQTALRAPSLPSTEL